MAVKCPHGFDAYCGVCGDLKAPASEKPILGPVRCVCAAPEQPYRTIDAGVFGTVACRRCARLLPSTHSAQLVTYDRLEQLEAQHERRVANVKHDLHQRLHSAILGVIG